MTVRPGRTVSSAVSLTGEASSYKIYEDEYTLAFLDLAGDAEAPYPW